MGSTRMYGRSLSTASLLITCIDCLNCCKLSSHFSGKMAPVTYKLSYFPGRGRAETARLIFAAAGVDYEDVRVQMKDWMPMKPTTPFLSLPLLEVDGQALGQSVAIYRYLAKETGFAGKNAIESAKIDAVADTITELFNLFTDCKITFAKEDEKPAKVKRFLEGAVPMLTLLEKLLKQNEGGDGYFVGSSMSWADMHLITVCEYILGMNEAVFDDFPKLKALINRVKGNEKIAAWIEKRPFSPF